MYCPSCGEKVPDDSEFCRHCGASVEQSTNDRQDDKESHQSGEPSTEPVGKTGSTAGAKTKESSRDPKLPITSVFVSILLLWNALEYANFSSIFFAIPGILIIPRVRRRVVLRTRDRFNPDLTEKGPMIVVGGLYAILSIIGIIATIGSTANDPGVGGPATQQLSVAFLTLLIMFAIAVVLVVAVRASRKIR